MAIRAAHGTGSDALVRVETCPVDELPPLSANDAREGLAAHKRRGRPFERGNRAGAGRKPALASAAGIPLDASDPLYRKALAWARRYRSKRITELSIQHGGALSSGVCGMLTTAALDMAASRYLTAKVAAGGDVDLLSLASKLGQAARQTELTALEIASREGKAAPRDVAAEIRRRILGNGGQP